MLKPLLLSAVFVSALSMAACENKAANETASEALSSTDASWPTLAQRLSCLPEEGVLVAAHRGTSRAQGLAENALESLRALEQGGIRIAEIDVAQLRSGEHILFHDGVWEEKSTGQGAVAQSRWRDVQTYLLKDTRGKITASRPVLLKDALAYAKGRLHLEIDFKSSAEYGEVVSLVRKAGMSEQVVLIAYNARQAAVLSRLAPDMFVSASVKSKADIHKAGVASKRLMAWVGKSENRSLMQQISSKGVTVLTQERGRNAPYREADIMVSDYALSKDVVEGAMGLSREQQVSYKSCLSQQ